jgi:23S rRNA (uracil1939-C5)-methyltransferase
MALALALPEQSEAKVHVTAAANGLDCVINAPPLQPAQQEKLIPAFDAAGLIRAVWNGDTVLLRSPPAISFGSVKVALPPGAFLQAVEACERDMASFVSEAMAKAADGPVCDLFAGLGAFSFRAARFAAVAAYEENAAAIAALGAAAKNANGLKPIKAVRRDLFRSPLGAMELNKFAAVIADPPREGAEAQCRAIASSKQETVVMISCNPTTFARDAALLTADGFSIARVQVFDQFRFSAHVEIAACFRREGNKKGGRPSAPRS